jgi:hypothetical protein
VFSKGGRASWSWVFRPAVEDHEQNHDWRSADNCLVEGFRDVLLAWSDEDPASAKPFVENLVRDDLQMLRRIGIHTLRVRWSSLRSIYSKAIRAQLFDAANIHEYYGLLKDHFSDFDDKEKKATLAALRKLTVGKGEDVESFRRQQARWLESMATSGYAPAQKWLAQLRADGFGFRSDHPDFNSYMEASWTGHGPSPYPPEELIAFVEDGSIIRHLTAFKPGNLWKGPTIEGLGESLKQAVVTTPERFARKLQLFVDIEHHYQNALIEGFKRSWESAKADSSDEVWADIWPLLLTFFEQLVAKSGNAAFAESGNGADWQVSLLADVLRSGTADDEHAYAPALLPRGWSIIEGLLGAAEGVARPDPDAMTQAINSPKGRTIEALWSHVLRECRLADQARGTHADEWNRMRGVIDRELAACAGANYEFSTLAGAYIANLDYLDHEWLKSKLGEIFSVEWPENLACAINGLAYAGKSRRLYVLLRDANVIDIAMAAKLEGRDTRKQLVERIILGYLWDEENLDGPRMRELFSLVSAEDFEAAVWFLSRVRGEELSSDLRGRIAAFLHHAATWPLGRSVEASGMLGGLAHLVWVLEDAKGKNGEVLLAIAPHVVRNHTLNEFVIELERFVEETPSLVADVVERMVLSNEIVFDYEGRLKTLIARVAANGERDKALELSDRLRYIPGMLHLFTQIASPT